MKKLAIILALIASVSYATLSTTYAPVSFTGNGATEFAFPYTFFAKSDLIVHRVTAEGVSSVLVEGSGAGKYTIYAANNDYTGGATVTTGSTYTDGQITIERFVPYGQQLSINGDFVPAKPLEQQLDKLAAQTQQVKNEISRTITIPVTDDASISTELPNAAARASKLVGCDEVGNFISVSAVGSGTIVEGDGVNVSTGNVISVDINTNGLEFTSSAVALNIDTSTLEFSGGEIVVVTVPDEAITLAKMADMGDYKLLGNVSGASATPAEVEVIDDDSMATAASNNLSSAESIVAYVSSFRNVVYAQLSTTKTLAGTKNVWYDTGLSNSITLKRSGDARIKADTTVSFGMQSGYEKQAFKFQYQLNGGGWLDFNLPTEIGDRIGAHFANYIHNDEDEGLGTLTGSTVLSLAGASSGDVVDFKLSVSSLLSTSPIYINRSENDADDNLHVRTVSSITLEEL